MNNKNLQNTEAREVTLLFSSSIVVDDNMPESEQVLLEKNDICPDNCTLPSVVMPSSEINEAEEASDLIAEISESLDEEFQEAANQMVEQIEATLVPRTVKPYPDPAPESWSIL